MVHSMPAAPRPPAWEEALSRRLFLCVSPRLTGTASPRPPKLLEPWQTVRIPRSNGRGWLSATWFPTAGSAKGAVLLAPPWQRWGRAYFHRRGRLQALRDAGYHSLTVDLPGFGESGPPAGFYDRDLADAAAYLDLRCPKLPLHLWGVSSGGYWSHPFLAATDRFSGAMFEDVSPHLLEWAWRTAPWGRPLYLFFQATFRRAYRFLDARNHAPALRLARLTYVAGGADVGIPVDSSRELADRSGSQVRIVPEAGHLEAIKRARSIVLDLALSTFSEAARSQPASSRRGNRPSGT